MLNVKVTNCRECADISKLLDKVNCQLAKMANNLYRNMSYMLNKHVHGVTISTLLHYKRILTYKACNEEWAEDYTVSQIASRVNALTLNCKCCEAESSGVLTTTTSTTNVSTTTTTTSMSDYTLFLVGATEQTKCEATTEEETISLWHNGENAFPMVGDVVYQDGLGLVPFYSGVNSVRWADGIVGDELMTDESGVMLLITCD
jgi:hypothetical protein